MSSLSRGSSALPALALMKMSRGKAVRAAVGVALCLLGFALVRPSRYAEHIYSIDAGGCHLVTSVIEPPHGQPQGTVILFHGLAASKRIMMYLAHGFADQGLRVYVPDLPGHGRSPASFSPDRSEQCSESLVHELVARDMITPSRTILAGHSMGGAIAFLAAAHIPVAGVIAISPAPMREAHGAFRDVLLFRDPPPAPTHTLIISGTWEPASMRSNAQELLSPALDVHSRYELLPHVSHVSLLFDPRALRDSQQWISDTLHVDPPSALPSRNFLLGSALGLVGLLLLTTPFLGELVDKTPSEHRLRASEKEPLAAEHKMLWNLLALALVSAVALFVLLFWIPIRGVRLFEGDYLASFLLISGLLLVAIRYPVMRRAFVIAWRPLLAATFAAVILVLLYTAWFDLSFTEAWLTSARWARMPILVAAFFPYQYAEEVFLGPIASRFGWRRLAWGLSLRLVAWLALLAGILLLHSGEILMVLLALYMLPFNILHRRAIDVVRQGTGSVPAAALFGAIILAGFCLVIFPIT